MDFSYLDVLTPSANEETPVPFREFVESPEFCGDSDMYDYWKAQGENMDISLQELIITGSLGGGKCIWLGHKISTNRGYLSGRELTSGIYRKGFYPVDGLSVEQPDGSFRRVSHVYYEEDAQARTIRSVYGQPVTVTPEHPILVRRNQGGKEQLVKAGQLVVGDKLLRRNFIEFPLQLTSDAALTAYQLGKFGGFTLWCTVHLASKSEALFVFLGQLVRATEDGFMKEVSSIEGCDERHTWMLSNVMDYLSLPYRIEKGERGNVIRIRKGSLARLSAAFALAKEMLGLVAEREVIEFLVRQVAELEVDKSLYVEDPIVSVEEGTADVFDVTVPSTHLFMSSNLVNHNTTFALYWMAYWIYNLFCLGPRLRKFLGVSESTELYVIYFSVSMTQAKRSGFRVLKSIIDGCKWFEDHYPRNKRIESEIEFPNKFYIVHGSEEGHAISLNVIGFILDEANFRKGVGQGMTEEYAEVTQLYTQLLDRQVSRFATKDGGVRSLAILVSSASYQSSFTEERKFQALHDPSAKVINAVAYTIKPWNYSSETFEVFIGTDQLPPQIVETEKQRENIIKALNVPEGMREQYFVNVPVSLKKFYTANILLALQNHSGVSTQIQGRLVQNLRLVQEAYYEPIKPWFPVQQVTLSNSDDFQLIELLDIDAIEKPEMPHCFFLDLSLRGDSGGFTCVRLDNPETKENTHVFTLEVIPPPYPAATRVQKFRQFMTDISEVVNVAAFATDQFQSASLRQDINADLGLTDIRISIDSSDLYYLEWLMNLANKNTHMLFHPTLHKEIKEAIHDIKRRRVVRAKGSTDDCLQSYVGAHWLANHVEAVSSELPVNVVGSRQVDRIARMLGYK